jgi:uncharacterized repeat protein (TIGR03803 family)
VLERKDSHAETHAGFHAAMNITPHESNRPSTARRTNLFSTGEFMKLFSVLLKPVVSGGLAFSLATGGAPAARAASESVVYAFESKQPDGAGPSGTLINGHGSLYGTTIYVGEGGPIGKCASNYGCGTVYVLSPPGVAGGPWTESMLYVFQGGDDGKFPIGALIMMGGALYGATQEGGARAFGAVFALAPPTTAGGSWTKSLVYAFNGGSDGANPTGGLINVSGTLYGMTRNGGANHAGTVFALAPPAIAGGSWFTRSPAAAMAPTPRVA